MADNAANKPSPNPPGVDGVSSGSIDAGNSLEEVSSSAVAPNPSVPSPRQAPRFGEAHRARGPVGAFLIQNYIRIFLVYVGLMVIWTCPPGQGYYTSALCKFPILPASTTSFCTSVNSSLTPSLTADYPRLMKMQSDCLLALLEEKEGLTAVSWELKKSEVAVGDFAALVKVSKFRSKGLLIACLVELQQAIRAASKSLYRLDKQVQWSAESTLDTVDFALRRLANQEPSLASQMAKPFDALDLHLRTLVNTSFFQSLETFSDRMGTVLVQSQHTITLLDNLERLLARIYEIGLRERLDISAEHTRLYAKVWTLLGGNRGYLTDLDDHVALLNLVSNYVNKALRIVRHTLIAVQQVESEVAQLRSELFGNPDSDDTELAVTAMQEQLYKMLVGLTRMAELVKATSAAAAFVNEEAVNGIVEAA